MNTLSLLPAFLALCAGAASAATVNVDISGVQPRGGAILATVQTEAQFMQRAATSGAKADGLRSGVVRLVIHDVPPGDYAVSALHDADEDQEMTLGPDQRAIEGWAMSGLSAPDHTPRFGEVKVHVARKDLTVRLTMRYPKAPSPGAQLARAEVGR